MQNVITVNNVWKKYKIGSPKKLTEAVSSFISGEKEKEFWALKGVNLKINEGETVGIIGPNGSGKSTLLKILAGVTQPTKGAISTNGRVASLLELGTGFHHELSGRENIYLYGSVLGINTSEVRKNFDSIVSFSGVEKFIDTPIKHYSSGMYVRLAFSIAVHLNAEILLIDEVLSVGDLYFQQKAQEKIREKQKKGTTIIIVSHDLRTIEDFCDRIVVFESGRMVRESKTSKALNSYIEQVTRQISTLKCRINKVAIEAEVHKLKVMVNFSSDKKLADLGIAVAAVITQKGKNVIAQRNYFLSGIIFNQCSFILNTKLLAPGSYNVTINITDKDVTKIYTTKENIYPFQVR